ncbi:MAG TPA: hypothetical protein VGN46_14245 [Luteibacter sp.]|jgi:hypothetical protein|uniref:hypothetical protein n=1 Tax=Luteibacter sp. TaxID=1886636 RepID=UPI002F3FBFB4
MSKTSEELQCDALSVAIKGLEKSYDDITKVYLGLDAKAQMCAGVSGVVIPATIALVKWSPNVASDAVSWVKFLGGAAIVTLIASIVGVVLAIRAMRLREYPLPYGEAALTQEVRDLIAQGTALVQAKHNNFLNGQMENLANIVNEADGLRSKKAALVGCAQVATWFALGSLTLTYALYFPLHALFPAAFT